MIVSIVIPARNEGKNLRETLDCLYAQDFLEPFEILIMDGNSSDDTRKVAEEYKKKYGNVRIFANPTGNTAIGRNIGVDNARGKFVMNYSAHAMAEKNMLSVLVGKLRKARKDVAVVGCANIAPNDKSFVARAVAVVYASIFGGVKNVDQNARFDKDVSVPSIAFALYRKEVLDEVGGFDDKFWCGQDFELNYRVIEKGYKIIFTPETHVFRRNRDSVRKFVRQMYRYGMARKFIMKKHPASFRWSYIIPSVFSAYIIGGACAAVFIPFLRLLYGLSLLAYVLIGWICSLFVTRDPLLMIVSPFFYFIEHFMYGVGFISGFFKHKF